MPIQESIQPYAIFWFVLWTAALILGVTLAVKAKRMFHRSFASEARNNLVRLRIEYHRFLMEHPEVLYGVEVGARYTELKEIIETKQGLNAYAWRLNTIALLEYLYLERQFGTIDVRLYTSFLNYLLPFYSTVTFRKTWEKHREFHAPEVQQFIDKLLEPARSAHS